MNLSGSHVILTGAGGGIGRCLALALAQKGAHLLLVERSLERLDAVRNEIAAVKGHAKSFAFDLSANAGHEQVVAAALQELGGLDLLINNAGLLAFVPLEEQQPAQIDAIMRVNAIAPMLLTRAALPHLLQQNSGRIVNIGSTFGSIGFAHFAAYSASKFAVRGFSGALRRELDDTNVGVTFIAPRATQTAINTDAVNRILAKTGANMDPPQQVAELIVAAIENERKDYYIGWPESFFARLNAILPRLVDGGLRKQARIAREYAKGN